MKRIGILVLLLAGMALLAASCAAAPPAPPAEEDSPPLETHISAYRFELTGLYDWMLEESGGAFSMLNEDGNLVIHVSEGTPVFLEDGTPAREALADGQTLAELLDGRTLEITTDLVLYSMPGQAFPLRIVVMNDAEEAPPEDRTEPETTTDAETAAETEAATQPTQEAEQTTTETRHAQRFALTDMFAFMLEETGGEFSMLNEAGDLVIHISEATSIVLEDGTPARDVLADGQTLAEFMDGRAIVIISDDWMLTSMPGQIFPQSIVVR